MSREIKFKFYDKYDRTLVGLGDVFALYTGFARENLDVMQYTNLKDKNGKEIYEGDIVKNNDEIWDLYYDEGAWKMGLNGKRTNNDHLFLLEPQHSEIIGNRFENPELLASYLQGK